MRSRLIVMLSALLWSMALGASALAEEDGGESVAEQEQDADGRDEAARALQQGLPSGASEQTGPAVGPGGKPLRADHPGTEASLQPRMQTNRIEGLQFGEGVESGEAYNLRIRELETKVDDLKERVFRSKSRIVLLKETVLSGNLAGSRAVIVYETKLGNAYGLRRAVFSLDGNRIFSRLDRDGDLARTRGFEVYSGMVSPGTHNVSVNLTFQGTGYGVFRYAEGYEFNLRSACQFVAEEGKTSIVTITAYEKGNVFTAHEDRPWVGCQVRMVELTRDELETVSTADRP
jgi:hypothetical protein